MRKAYAGGMQEQEVFQMPQEQVMMDEVNKIIEVKKVDKNSFEYKAQQTIEYLGDTWGYGFVLLLVLAGVIGRKQIGSLLINPKDTLKKWITKK